MKKVFKNLFILFCFTLLLSGCGSSSSRSEESKENVTTINNSNNELKEIYDIKFVLNDDEINLVGATVADMVDFLEQQKLVVRYDVGHEYPYKKFPQQDYAPGDSESVFVDKGSHQYSNLLFGAVNDKNEDIPLGELLIWNFEFGDTVNNAKIKIDDIEIDITDKITPEEIDEKFKDLNCDVKAIVKNPSYDYKSIYLLTKDYEKAEVMIFFDNETGNIHSISYNLWDYFASVKK